MIPRTIPFGSIAGIPVRLHITLVLVLVAAIFFTDLGLFGTLFLATSILSSIVLHELGHSLVARSKGSYIHEIVLYPIGGVAKISNLPVRSQDEILVAISGPAVSLLLAGICWWIPLLKFMAYVNTTLFIFNLIPAFPMDGGRVLRALLAMKKGLLEGTRIAAEVGKYICILFVVIGIFGLGPISPSLWLVFIGFYIYRIGQQEYKMIKYRQNMQPKREGLNSFEVEVSPPPYSEKSSLLDYLKNLFKR